MGLLEDIPRPLKVFLFAGSLFFIFCCGSSPTQEAENPTLRPTFTVVQSVASPVPATDTAIPPTDTAVPPTATEAQPTDTPSPAPTQAPSAKVAIARVFNSGYEERVEIENQGNAPQNLEGWTVSGSKGDETYRFPSYVLEAGATVRLHSGKNGVNSPPTDIYWTDKTVWNNDGEIVYLRDAQGNLHYPCTLTGLEIDRHGPIRDNRVRQNQNPEVEPCPSQLYAFLTNCASL